MTTSSKTDILVKAIKSSFNNPALSDVVLVINDVKYYVISSILAHHAPKLFSELESTSTIPLESGADAQQMLSSLTSILTKTLGKKTLMLTDPTLNKEVVHLLLESMYDKSVEITNANVKDVYTVSTRFGMIDVSAQCTEVMTKAIIDTPNETLLESYSKALEEKSFNLQKWENLVAARIAIIPKEKVLDFVSKMSYDGITTFLSFDEFICSEELVYEMADNWCVVNAASDDPLKFNVMSKVRLELLTDEVLMTKAKTNPFIKLETYIQSLEKIMSSVKHSRRTSRNVQMFALGELHSKYAGYRLVTKEEVEMATFKTTFIRSYNHHNGVTCLDTYDANYICCTTNPIAILDNRWMKTDSCPITKDIIVKLRAAHHTSDSFSRNISTLKLSPDLNSTKSYEHHDTGLFVPIGTTF